MYVTTEGLVMDTMFTMCDDQGQVLYSVGHSCQYTQLFVCFPTEGTQRTQV